MVQDVKKSGNTLITNSTFLKVIEELLALGDEATQRASDDPKYQQFIKLYTSKSQFFN